MKIQWKTRTCDFQLFLFWFRKSADKSKFPDWINLILKSILYFFLQILGYLLARLEITLFFEKNKMSTKRRKCWKKINF